MKSTLTLSSSLLCASLLFLLLPAVASASYQPGQTLNPTCPPSDGTCIVVPSTSQWATSGANISYTAGNLGVGTTSPSALLTIDSTSTLGSIIRLSNADTGGHIYDLLSTGSGNTGGAGRLDFFDKTAGLARLSIAANGNVGIGTTSPFATFSVAGNGYLSGNLNVGDATTTRSNLGLPYALSQDVLNVTTGASTNIAAWGDSLTSGNQDGTGTTYPAVLAGLSGYYVFNGGVSGDTSAQIAANMLAQPALSVWPTVIWAGRNDITGNVTTDEPVIESNIASIASALQSSGNNNYIILSIINGEGEGTGTTNYNEIIAINNDLASIYGCRRGVGRN